MAWKVVLKIDTCDKCKDEIIAEIYHNVSGIKKLEAIDPLYVFTGEFKVDDVLAVTERKKIEITVLAITEVPKDFQSPEAMIASTRACFSATSSILKLTRLLMDVEVGRPDDIPGLAHLLARNIPWNEILRSFLLRLLIVSHSFSSILDVQRCNVEGNQCSGLSSCYILALVIILGTNSELRAWPSMVKEIFGLIENRILQSPIPSWRTLPLRTSTMIPEFPDYKGRYITMLLGHESGGSISALLKSLVQNVISIVFSYIKLVHEKGVVIMSFKMFPAENWVMGAAFPREFNAELIRRELELLTPERVGVFHSSKAFEDLTTEREQSKTTY
ncbi:hypothetical protein SELMODRAFT_410993 [Selaginella moellendorffii]|uniref:Uncharacterized protein n=1 Tax=Selaginella moellendorffii TaxID=88036 RepID=D8RHN5_SELML|nr:hypothetical protein SELMODRAFT_410993 [Selaginella moellendorffii]